MRVRCPTFDKIAVSGEIGRIYGWITHSGASRPNMSEATPGIAQSERVPHGSPEKRSKITSESPLPDGSALSAPAEERLDNPDLYFNRELSLLQFQRRVFAEALDPQVPLLERVKFLGILQSNIDEFFMVRVAG